MSGRQAEVLRSGAGCRGNSIAKNIASALAFLHKKKVVHLDVKSPNILLSSNNVAKLGCRPVRVAPRALPCYL